jgi:hypothetical protein
MQHNDGRGLANWLLRNRKWWPVGLVLAIVLSIGWRYDGRIPGYGDRVAYGALWLILLSTPGISKPLIEMARRINASPSPLLRRVLRLLHIEDSDLGDLMTMLCVFAHVLWSGWLIILLLRAANGIAEWLAIRGRAPDRGTLVVCLLLALLALYSSAAHIGQKYLAKRNGTQEAALRRMQGTAEAAWFFGLLSLALVPAALRASVVPNLLFGVIVPIIVFYGRMDAGSTANPHAVERVQ